MTITSFSKYSACGNDFILLDNREKIFPVDNSSLIQTLCHRQNGIGADGLILLENSKIADYRMRVFNSDGCEAKMCGNGIRCLGKFLKEFDESITKIAVEVSGTGYLLSIGPKSVQVHMGPPTALTLHLSLEIGTEKISYDFIDTGVPHAVIFTDSLEQINVNELGLKIRHHPNFDPDGTNVNFAKVLGDDRIAIRSFERGVEKETLACGTGAAAAAIAAWKRLALANPIKVITRSGEEIEFLSKNDGARIKNMIMYGPARLIFRGEIELPPFCCE